MKQISVVIEDAIFTNCSDIFLKFLSLYLLNIEYIKVLRICNDKTTLNKQYYIEQFSLEFRKLLQLKCTYFCSHLQAQRLSFEQYFYLINDQGELVKSNYLVVQKKISSYIGFFQEYCGLLTSVSKEIGRYLDGELLAG